MSNSKDDTCESSTRNGSQSLSSVQLKSSMLRPSLFGASLKPAENAHSSIVDEPKVNPFLKDSAEDEGDEEGSAKNPEDSKAVQKEDPLSLLKKNGLPKSNLFTTVKSSIAESSGFVFGQNVHERVVGENVQSTSKSEENKESSEAGDAESTSNTSTSSLFSNVIQNSKNQAVNQKESESKSLTEIAREYEESRAQKRKYEEVETFTGEEDEVNVLDVSCKLFAFVNRNWEERGRGSLRLNDSKNEKNSSRVVFRTSGNLRLLVNTKVWSGMVAERPSPKSLRLTAMDNTGQVKVFLAMSRPDDIAALYNALDQRINAQKQLDEKKIDAEASNSKSSVSSGETSDEPSPKKPAVDLN